MNEAQVPILSREWWLTVVIVGLVIHLLASYLKPQLDRVGGKLSRAWSTRNAVRAREHEARVELLRRNESRKWMAAYDELRARIMAVTALVYALSCLVGALLFALLEYRARTEPPTKPPIILRVMAVTLALIAAAAGFAFQGRHDEAERIQSELSEALETPDEE